jgi:hypothetical protein
MQTLMQSLAILSRWNLVVATTLVALVSATPANGNPAIEGYSNYEQFTARVKQLDASELAKVTSLGKSVGGRDVWLITVGTGKPDDKPALAVVGNVHAPQLAGGEIALRMAEQLIQQAAEDDELGKLLAERTIYFIPQPNPDGNQKAFAKPYREQAGNDRPSDDDRDFQFGEDPPDDLNGDGWITMMRVEDAAGEYVPHPDDPRVLIKADPKKDERGKYRLLVEGRDDDNDEAFNEDGGDGVALDRNFTFEYEPFSPAAGPQPVSEPEYRALADFLFSRPNIALVLSFSLEDNLLHPWKPNSQAEGNRIKTTVQSADAGLLDFLAAEYRKINAAGDPPDKPDAAGEFSLWAYYHYGRWSLATRGWWIPQIAEKPADAKPAEGEIAEDDNGDKKGDKSKKASDDKRGAAELNRLRWLKQSGIEGFVDWQRVEHPDFPGKTVEIGGFKPFYDLNPPAKELDGLAKKHLEFLTRLPKWLPQLEIHSAKAEALGGGLFRITASIVNPALLPTMSKMGDVNGEAYPLQIALEAPKDTVFLQGHPRLRQDRLSGGGNASVTWLVRFPQVPPKTCTVKLYAPAVGEVSQPVELPR